ncbi:MAG: GNAT family N-acetyltransferase [Chitinophagaceae bacterium]|nr:GNAT family N-acetyltransferase [Chitinophagaceae bacterium]
MINIIEYEQKHHEDFRRLNLEWLEKYNLAESHDLEILDDPKGTILDRGGVIYMAQAGEELVGSAALMKEEEGVYELAKMAVTTSWQGKGISKMLLEKCLATARSWNAGKVTLYSNSQLQTALTLYKKYGFYHVPAENSPFVTADVRMELIMNGKI